MRTPTKVMAITLLVFLSINVFAQSFEGEKADVNNDGAVNILDALKVVNHILGTDLLDDQEFWRADCSAPEGICYGDSAINILDVLKIVNVVLGLDQCPEAGSIILYSLDPTSGPPGTQIKVTTNFQEIDAQQFYVTADGSKCPILSSGDSSLVFLVPLMEPGEVKVVGHGWNYYFSDTLTFNILSLEPTELPPGDIVTGINDVTFEITDFCQDVVSILADSGYISIQDTADFVEALDRIRQILDQTQILISQLPEDEKELMDEYLYASGLSDGCGITGDTGLRKEIRDYRAFLAQQGEFEAFYGFVCLDNISFVLSNIKPIMLAASVSITIGTFGVGSGISAPLAMAAFALDGVDKVIEGFLPTDLYKIDVDFVPNHSGFFEIGSTATGDFRGYFESQTSPTEATVGVFLSSFLVVGEVSIVEDLLMDIGEYYALDAATNILNLKPITIPYPLPIDMNYYAISLIDIFDLVNPLGFNLSSVCRFIGTLGKDCPDLGIHPIVFHSDQVAYDLNTNTLTAVQAGELKKSDMEITVWRMDRACEGEDDEKPWWGWACMGVELPEFIESSEIEFSSIKIYGPNEPPTAWFTTSYEGQDTTYGNINTVFYLDASTSSDDRDPIFDLEVRWDFENDGEWDVEWDTTKICSVQFDEVDNHPIKLEVRDSGGLIGSIVNYVEVRNTPPVASFTVTPSSGTVQTVFVFDASPSWDLEDDDSELDFGWICQPAIPHETRMTFSYQFSTPGTKRMVLTVTDTRLAWDQMELNIEVEGAANTPPNASFTVSPSSGTTETTFQVDASGCSDNEDPSSVLQVHWDWENDGTYDTGWSTTKTASHQYPTTGTKTIKLEVKDSGDLKDVETMQVTVGESPVPDPPALVSPSNGSSTSDDTPTFDWSDVSGAVAYELMVDNNSNFASPEISLNNLTSSTYIPTSSLSDGTYYWQVRAKDNLDNWGEWSTTWSFTIATGGDCGTVTDYDGNTYQTIQIGDQCWMAENLKVTHYRNGDPIPNVTSASEWDTLTSGAYCNYDNDSGNVATYGRLYNWYAVDDSRNIAPSGWHVPTDEEWKQLEMYLGMSQSEADDTGWRGTNEGGKLKEEGTTNWSSPNVGATNESGFTALPGGHRRHDGSYTSMGDIGIFSSSTEHCSYTDYAWYRNLNNNYSSVGRGYHDKRFGFSVRCVKGELTNTAPNASFTVDPTSGIVSTIFNVDASGSTDNEDASSALEVRWDWENDGTYDTGWSTTKTATNQYSTEGTKTIKLEVKDTGGLTDYETRQVTISSGCATVTDIDGNIYQTVQIGDQCWMAENLKVTHYRNGDSIPNVTDNTEWAGLSTGAYCVYNNDAGNVATYGRLYNWYTVDDSRNIAPEEWHVPTDEEWKQLEMYLGISQVWVDALGWRGTNEGGKLKTTGTIEGGDGLWYAPNTGATNESGFSVVPCGFRSVGGIFANLGLSCCIWSSTEGNNSALAWRRCLYNNNSMVNYHDSEKNIGFTIRCIKN